jgi:hypothetical protein
MKSFTSKIMGALHFLTKLDDIILKRVLNWSLPIMLALLVTFSMAELSIDHNPGGIPDVDFDMKEISNNPDDPSIDYSNDIGDNWVPALSWQDMDWKDGLPLAHAYAVKALQTKLSVGNSVLAINIFCSFVSLLLIRKITLRIWTLQELGGINLSIDIDEVGDSMEGIVEEIGDILENAESLISEANTKIKEGKESLGAIKRVANDPLTLGEELDSRNDESSSSESSTISEEEVDKHAIAKKRAKDEPSMMAKMFSIIAMFSYFFYLVQADVNSLPLGIAMAQMFTLFAVLFSTSRLAGKKPHSFLIVPAIILSILSSPIGVIVVLPVLLFLIIGELTEDEGERSMGKKVALALLFAVIGGLATALLVSNILTDLESVVGVMVAGIVASLLTFTPFLAILSIIPLDKILEPVERSFIIYLGALFGLTLLSPPSLLGQLHYAIIIPGSILAAFAITNMLEDFTTDLVEKVTINSVKFFATLGALPIISIVIHASHKTAATSESFYNSILEHFTISHLLMIGIGLTGLMYLMFSSGDRTPKEDSSEGLP